MYVSLYLLSSNSSDGPDVCLLKVSHLQYMYIIGQYNKYLYELKKQDGKLVSSSLSPVS